MEMIKVVDDWTWVRKHVGEALRSDEKLYNSVLDYLENRYLTFDEIVHQIGDLYHEGLTEGMEEGKYFSFRDWFYEFTMYE